MRRFVRFLLIKGLLEHAHHTYLAGSISLSLLDMRDKAGFLLAILFSRHILSELMKLE